MCASDTTRIISEQVVDSVTFSNQLGCAQVPPDQQLTMDVLAGYANMSGNIDVDASPLIYGEDLEKMGNDLLKMVADVASGKQTKAESLGYVEMAIARVCNFV